MVGEVIEARRGLQRRRIDRLNLVVMLIGLAGLLLVIGRVAQLQMAPDERLRAHIQERVSKKTEPARRGDVVDRRGRLLAATRPGKRLFVDPSAFEEPYGEKFEAISRVTGVPVYDVAERIIERLVRNRERLERGETPIQYVSIGGALDDTQLAMAQRLDYEGVHLETVPVRESTAGDSVAALIGKVGVDGHGLVGAERSFDVVLDEDDGAIGYVRDAMGRPLWVEANAYRPAAHGDRVRLSIDLVIQNMVLEELRRGLEEADAAGGRAIVLDPNTGEILAMVDAMRDVPDAIPYSRQAFLESLRAGRWQRFRVVPDDPLRELYPALARSRCVVDVYEPGSTFKPFMWAAATERGFAKPEDVIETNSGTWKTDYGRPLEDVHPMAQQSWHDVLVNSSNIGMAKVTSRMSHEQMRTDVLRFGFGRATGIGLPGESPGLVTGARDWSKFTQTSVAFGYEIAVTPLQLVRGFSAFARSDALAGTLPKLTLRAKDASDDAAQTTLERVVSRKTAELTRGAMGGVAAKLLERYPKWKPEDPKFAYSMFGKSGTAKIARPDGGYFERQYVSSFVAGAPVDFPRIVVLVVIDDPGPELRRHLRHYGSQVAGPVVVRITRRTLEYLGVPAPAADVSKAVASAR